MVCAAAYQRHAAPAARVDGERPIPADSASRAAKEPGTHRLPDGVGTNGVFTEGP